MKSIALACAAAILSTGCASVVNDSTHPVKVETRNPAGELVSGAECQLTNDYGSVSLKSGDTTPVRRSSKDLDIVCKGAGQAEARGRAISRANGGMWGNIILGGGIGAVIDHNKGTAYTFRPGCSWCSARCSLSIAPPRRKVSRCRAPSRSGKRLLRRRLRSLRFPDQPAGHSSALPLSKRRGCPVKGSVNAMACASRRSGSAKSSGSSGPRRTFG